MENWTSICRLEEIPRQGARVVCTVKGDIAVFRTTDDQVFALVDRCPHKAGPLSQGIVAGRTVTCPLHGMKIRLDNGQAEAPDEGHASCIAVRLDNDGLVWLALEA